MSSAINNRRIAKNTFFLYIRMLFKMIVSLYTSRLILDYLGVTDYGIYNVVGGIVVLFSFLNSAMTASVQRFLSFELGKMDETRVRQIFSLSVWIHLVIALVVFIVSEVIGYLLLHKLNIPANRWDAAIWVFHISIFSTCISMLQTPFNALIVAYERMGVYAYLSIIDTVLKLAIVFLLPFIPMDYLISYALLVFVTNLLVQLFYTMYTSRQMQVRIQKFWDPELFRQLMSFASWSMLGEIAWAAVGQGINMVLNLFFMPAVNAARAIALQVLVAMNQFVANFQTAMNPQIVKLYSANVKEEMYRLTFNGIRFSFYLMLMISLPVIFKMDYILELWLKQVPSYTSSFCILAIIGSFCDILSNLFATVVKSTGKIRNYQILVSVCLILNLPISFLLLHLGMQPESVYVVYIAISLILVIVRVGFLKRMIGFPVRIYCKQVLLPVLFISCLTLSMAYFLSRMFENTWYDLCLFIATTLCLTCVTIYTFGFTQEEKSLVLDFIKNKIK